MLCYAGLILVVTLCGISLMNANYLDSPKVIESLIRYHYYYQIRKFMKHPKLIDKYSISKVRDHIPYRVKEIESSGTDGNGNTFFLDAKVEHSGSDYLSFISPKSDGMTTIGQSLLQESIESYVYSILGRKLKQDGVSRIKEPNHRKHRTYSVR